MSLIYPSEISMDAIAYTTAAQNLAETFDRVCADHETIIVTREAQESVVIMSLADYNSLEETAFLLRSPKNAQRLLASIAELEAGHGMERELLD
jgi:antitoxin YefM